VNDIKERRLQRSALNEITSEAAEKEKE